jgi:hypothetical protein
VTFTALVSSSAGRLVAAIDERLAVADAVAARWLPEIGERRIARFRRTP